LNRGQIEVIAAVSECTYIVWFPGIRFQADRAELGQSLRAGAR
jgi:hypothetical protein